MAILGTIVKRTIDLNTKIPRRRRDVYKQQLKTLKKLLTKAEFTAFGEHYNFTRILSEADMVEAFRSTVEINDYSSMFRKWWYRTLNGEAYVCWPERVKYFALSSGTSEQSSKHIPVTKDMMRAIKKSSVRQILALGQYDLPPEFFQKGMLMIGGSTHLNYNGTYYSGDLSGITTGNVPFWFQHFYKPGNRIARERDWHTKLEEIVRNARQWDIGIVAGVPAWIQILFEKIIEHYKVKTIHDIWPNLTIYVWGGVSIKPYKKGFEKLTAKPLTYLETYLASEGFIAFQKNPDTEGQKLVTDNGIFFEFIPFNDENFDSDGVLKKDPKTYTLAEVDGETEYALLISTCSGAWRYMIGDTVRFTDVENAEVKITGRTKQFLSLCGEHLSQDNMTRAIELVAEEMDVDIKEFTVAGVNYQNLFAHHWYIGTNDPVDAAALKVKLDEHLKELNDDYRVERMAALKDIIIEVLPTDAFLEWMKKNGKLGSQHKFPRVMKHSMLDNWQQHLQEFKKEFSLK